MPLKVNLVLVGQSNATLFAETSVYETVGYDSYVAGVITLTDNFAAGTIIPGLHRIKDNTTEKDYPIASVSLAGGAGADTVTLDTVAGGGGEASPPAALNTGFDIILPRDLGGAIAGGNTPASEDGRYIARHTIAGDKLFDLNQVTASPYINLKIYVDGVLTYEKNISSTKAFKLPKGFKGKRWEIELSGSIPVRRFDTATTIKELLN